MAYAWKGVWGEEKAIEGHWGGWSAWLQPRPDSDRMARVWSAVQGSFSLVPALAELGLGWVYTWHTLPNVSQAVPKAPSQEPVRISEAQVSRCAWPAR